MRFLAVLLAVASACKSGSAPRAAGAISEAEAKAFAEQLGAQAKSCSETTVGPLFETRSLSNTLCQWLAGISSYQLVGMRTVEGQPRPVMRRFRVDPKGALHVNYDQLKLVRKDQKVLLVDAYAYRQGKWISDHVAEQPHPDVAGARQQLQMGNVDGALALLDKLPADVRRDRSTQQLIVTAASTHSPERGKQALAELAATFPNDPSIALAQIDGAYDLEDYDAMLRWIDLLAKDIGNEPYLETLRAVAYLKKKDLDAALARIDSAIKLEPMLSRAHEVRMEIMIEKKQWKDVLAEMTELEKKHGFRFEEAKLRAEPRLAELVASPEFTQWLGAR